MFDIYTTVITRGMAWVSILLYSAALIYTLASYKKWPTTSNSKSRNLFWLLFLGVFAVTYTIDSDFFHYKEMVSSTREVLDYGLELVYQHIILFIDNNYLLFRIIIFGGAALIYYFVLARFDINKTVGILLMVIVFGGIFSYARATLAFSLYYLGLSFIIPQGVARKTRGHSFRIVPSSLLIGLCFIAFSYFFHRSMLILIALTPLVFLKLDKKSIYIIALVSPLSLYALRTIMGDVFSLLTFDAVIDQRITKTYAEAIESNANWRGVVGSILHYGKYVISFIIISISIFRNQLRVNRKILHLYSFYAALTYIAILCYPLFEGNIIYSHRFLNMTIVPIIVIVAYLYKNKYMPFRHLSLVVYWSVANSFLGFARYIF